MSECDGFNDADENATRDVSQLILFASNELSEGMLNYVEVWDFMLHLRGYFVQKFWFLAIKDENSFKINEKDSGRILLFLRTSRHCT